METAEKSSERERQNGADGGVKTWAGTVKDDDAPPPL